ncbi:MAG: fibronectin type III domain-containing protein, partial [Bacteroidota bacterium]
MKNHAFPMLSKLLPALILLYCSLGLSAQVFPVDVQQNLVEPFQRLDELALSPQYQVALTLRDPLESGVAVQLRLKIEGQNIRVRTRPEAVPRLHPIEFGQPLILTGSDLAYLFAPSNLNVAGRGTRDFWDNGGRLAEGFYTICVEAFLPNRPTELGVSNEHCVPIFVNYDEPPVITYPLDGQHIPAFSPPAFAFTWQNQSTVQMPNYLLEVTPLDVPAGSINIPLGNPDPSTAGGFGDILGNVTVNGFYPSGPTDNSNPLGNNGNPNLPIGNATNANAPLLFKQDLLQNSYNLLPEDPQLISGHRYVVRVRAYDPSGQRRFRNAGWSQPVVFTYGIECREVVNVSSLVVADSRVRLNWNIGPGGGNEQGFTVGILNENNPQANWYNISTTLPTLLLDRLEPASRYRFRIRANCDGGISGWTFGNFTTPAGPNTEENEGPNTGNTTATTSPTDQGNFVVGDEGEPYQPEIESCSPNASQGRLSTRPDDPTQRIKVNDQFEFAGFPIRAVTVEGGVPSYSGKGTLLIPWLEQGAISVRYSGIKLDADRRATAGTISPKRGKDKFDATKFAASLGNDEECANYTETQLDQRGFSDAGVHYLTGTPLDPYGFDVNGLYHGTDYDPNTGLPRDPRGFDANGLQPDGTEYDSNGCNRDSLNAYGQPCVWRTGSTSANTEGDPINGADSGGNASTAGAPGNQNQTGGTNSNSTNNSITPSGTSTASAPTIEGTAYASGLGDSLLQVLTKRAVDSMLVQLATQKTRSKDAQQLASLAIS